MAVLVVAVAIAFLAKNFGKIYGDAELNPQSIFLTTLIFPVLLVLVNQNERNSLKNSYFRFFKVNGLACALMLFFSWATLKVGSRYSVIQLGITLLGVLSIYVKPIKFRWLALMLFLGVAMMSYVSLARNAADRSRVSTQQLVESRRSQSREISPLWNNALDLIINTRNIYKGMEYVDSEGFNYGKHIWFVRIWSPVPLLPTVMTNLFLGVDPVELSSQQILTEFTRKDSPGLDFELGSNVVIDAYMDFGLAGVLVMFWLAGRFIQFLELHKYRNIYARVVYLIMLSTALFTVRSGLLDQFRAVIWALGLVWLLLHIADNLYMKNILKVFKNEE